MRICEHDKHIWGFPPPGSGRSRSGPPTRRASSCLATKQPKSNASRPLPPMTDLMTPDGRTSFTLHSPPRSPSPPSPHHSPSTPSTFSTLEVVPSSLSSPSYIMERLREWWKPTYEPLEDQDEREDGSSPKAQRVSRFEYFAFLSLGVAM